MLDSWCGYCSLSLSLDQISTFYRFYVCFIFSGRDTLLSKNIKFQSVYPIVQGTTRSAVAIPLVLLPSSRYRLVSNSSSPGCYFPIFSSIYLSFSLPVQCIERLSWQALRIFDMPQPLQFGSFYSGQEFL